MDKKSGPKNTSDEESKSQKTIQEEDDSNKTLLEEEIKKIISDLDINFDNSTAEDDDPGLSLISSIAPPESTANSSITEANTSKIVERAGEISSRRVESTSISPVTTVIHKKIPTKVESSHLKSNCCDWHKVDSGIQREEKGHHRSSRHLMNQEFYRQDGDGVTEMITTSPLLLSTDNSDQTSYGQAASNNIAHYLQPSINQLPQVPEEQWNYGTIPINPDHMINHKNQNMPKSHNFQNQHNDMPNYGSSCRYCPQLDPYSYQPQNPREYQYPYPQETHCHNYQGMDQNYQTHLPTQHPIPNMKEIVNRYNSNHMTYVPSKPQEKPKRSLTDLFWPKKSEESDSGETVPQLYKACVTQGSAPQRFIFKAIPQPTTQAATNNYSKTLGPYQSSYAPEQTKFPVVNAEKSCTLPIYDHQYRQCYCMNDIGRKSGQKKKCDGQSCYQSTGLNNKGCYNDFSHGYVAQDSIPEKVDIYCFDQQSTGGVILTICSKQPNAMHKQVDKNRIFSMINRQNLTPSFLRTSDHPPPLYTDVAIQRTEKYATVFWAETFGAVNVVTAFIIAMLLQTFKFFLQGIIRPVLIGLVQIFSDYLFKPLLTLIYNGITQPFSIFLYNVIASIRDIMQPLAKGLGYFFELIATILKSIRIVEVKNVTNITPYGCSQPVKY